MSAISVSKSLFRPVILFIWLSEHYAVRIVLSGDRIVPTLSKSPSAIPSRSRDNAPCEPHCRNYGRHLHHE